MAKGVLTPPSEDFPRWYQDVIAAAKLAENGPVRGTMVIRANGYAIWELMQADMDRRIKATGTQNYYFPLFIPNDYLTREAEHVEGFSPELAVVTHGGGKKLEEPVIVRPTSETIVGEYMGKWIQSYRDLPLLTNQWANVVRWELRPRLFLRTTEFLWQEGHCAHETEADARDFALHIHRNVYKAFMNESLAMPVIPGRKTEHERFAGATTSHTLEGLMGDNKALQMGTSHELGQNFARAFHIEFTGRDGTEQTAWTTSWGSSARMLGGLIMCHGDAAGLRLPPRIAPTQALLLLVKETPELREGADRLLKELRDAGVRARLDDETDRSYGRRVVDAELVGIPLRVELGPREFEEGVATVVHRITGAKERVGLGDISRYVIEALGADQDALYHEAQARLTASLHDVQTLDQAREAAQNGLARIPWKNVGSDGERQLKNDSITVRCLVDGDGNHPNHEVPEDQLLAVVGRSY